MDLFKKSNIVGVSVTPEIGLEVAQIDFETKTVLKYGVRPLEFNVNQREIADLDIFKDHLQDLLMDLQISPKDTEIVLNVPAALFKINDYPAAMDDVQIQNAIEEDILDHYLFKENEAVYSEARLPNSSMQFNKYAYTAVSKGMVLELAIIIKDLGYKLHAIDTSVNSTVNSLRYLERVDAQPDSTWLLLLVENYCCRVVSMIGSSYIDVFEEKISIGEVLGDAENYATVINAVSPLIKNLPSKYLCVVSKTSVISAEILANKLTYSAPITYQEANSFSSEAFLEFAPEADSSLAKSVSLDVIAAAIYREFAEFTPIKLNLFNKQLGDIYISEQPPEIFLLGRNIVLSNQNLIMFFIIFLVLAVVLLLLIIIPIIAMTNSQKTKAEELEQKIQTSQQFLKDNESVSSDLFDEGDEIRLGLAQNKNVYSYYTIVGTEIPKKLWLTYLKLGDKITVEGQADNLESVYGFFRSIKDYDPESDIKLQKLGLASESNSSKALLGADGDGMDAESLLTTLNADFYEFRISNEPEISKKDLKKSGGDENSIEGLEPIKE